MMLFGEHSRNNTLRDSVLKKKNAFSILCANFQVTGMTRPGKKSHRRWDSNPGSSALEADALTTRPTRRYVSSVAYAPNGAIGQSKEVQMLAVLCKFLLNKEVDMVVVAGCLLNVPATGWCISGTDLLRQLYARPH